MTHLLSSHYYLYASSVLRPQHFSSHWIYRKPIHCIIISILWRSRASCLRSLSPISLLHPQSQQSWSFNPQQEPSFGCPLFMVSLWLIDVILRVVFLRWCFLGWVTFKPVTWVKKSTSCLCGWASFSSEGMDGIDTIFSPLFLFLSMSITISGS